MTTRTVTDPEGTTPSRSNATIKVPIEYAESSFDRFYVSNGQYIHDHYDAATQTFTTLSSRELTKEEQETLDHVSIRSGENGYFLDPF